jgi:hypothetical protein
MAQIKPRRSAERKCRASIAILAFVHARIEEYAMRQWQRLKEMARILREVRKNQPQRTSAEAYAQMERMMGYAPGTLPKIEPAKQDTAGDDRPNPSK